MYLGLKGSDRTLEKISRGASRFPGLTH